MFITRWRLFYLLGIPIFVDLSWLLILILITGTLTTFFQKELPGHHVFDYFIMALVSAVSFFACVVLHELGHATVGRALGMPIRGITLFMFGGVAELGGEPPSASSEFLMAIAGPIVSAVLGLAFWLSATFGKLVGLPAPVLVVLGYLAAINWLVLIFNMVPAFPLDGGRVLRSILWGISKNLRQSTHWAALMGQAFAWLLIVGGVFLLVDGLRNGGDSLFLGIWFGLIGMFLNNAARDSYRQVLIRQALEGEPVSRFMNRRPIVVSPFINLRSWVEDYVYRYHRKTFPVASNGHLEGYITTQALHQYPRPDWDQHTVAEAMQKDLDRITIAPGTQALDALGKMQSTGSSRLLVTEGDRLVGILSLKDLLHFLQLKMELEGTEEKEPKEETNSQEKQDFAHR